MFRKIWGLVTGPVHRRREHKKAYQKFLRLLAQSPAKWVVSDDGHIRSCEEDECPLVHVYQRLIGTRGLISNHENAHFVADLMGLPMFLH